MGRNRLIYDMIQKSISNNRNYKNVSLHILIATIGNKTIMRILKSLRSQMDTNDFVTIVYDNKDIDNTFSKVTEYTKHFRCKINIIMEEKNLGYWGHGIRNKYCNIIKEGDFLMHADDDDKYKHNSIGAIKYVVANKPKKNLYIFRSVDHKYRSLIPKLPIFQRGNVGTPNCIVPISIINKGVWRNHYGGDFFYYKDISKHVSRIIFIPIVIYEINIQE